jgi:hypothetical protein
MARSVGKEGGQGRKGTFEGMIRTASALAGAEAPKILLSA